MNKPIIFVKTNEQTNAEEETNIQTNNICEKKTMMRKKKYSNLAELIRCDLIPLFVG